VRILFINQCYWPDHVSSAQHLTDLAEGLAARGHAVTVLCSRNPYNGGRPIFARRERHHGVQIRRVATLGFGKRFGIKGRLLDNLSFHLAAHVKGVCLPAPDVVVTLTSPLLCGVLGWLLAGVKRAKHVHWCMDLFPDTALLFGIVKENSPAHRICAFLTRRYLRSAERVVAISPYMAGPIKQYGVADDRLRVVPVWAVGKDLRPVLREDNWFLRAHRLQDKFVVMLSGNLELGGDMDTLIGAVAALRHERDIVFVLISEGPRLEKFRTMTEQASLSNVRFLPYQDRRVLAHSLSAGDVHVVTNKEGLGGLRVPGKFYGILAVGRPILYLGDPCCEVADLIRDHRLGFVLKEGDIGSFVRAVRELRSDPAGRQAIAARARALFEAGYAAQPNIDLWEEVLTSTVAPKARMAEEETAAQVRALSGTAARDRRENQLEGPPRSGQRDRRVISRPVNRAVPSHDVGF
jgi:colanic acid biosynthesis glycosyl transferase WcaI